MSKVYHGLGLSSKTCGIKQEKLILVFLSGYAFFSGFVFVEPSPAEFLFLIFSLYLILIIRTNWDLLLITFSLFSSTIVSAVFGQLTLDLFNMRFVIIDLYLFCFFLFVSSYLINSNSFNNVKIIMNFWILSSLTNLFFSLLSVKFEGQVFGIELLIYGIRMKGFFKDPNVLGPFLVPPSVYLLKNFFEEKGSKVLNIVGFTILSFGVLITFSRAAWLNYFVTFTLFLIFKLKNRQDRKLILIVVFFLIFVSIIFWELSSKIFIFDIELKKFLIGRAKIHEYDQGRFGAQKKFIEIWKDSNILFGIGPGNYEVFANMATHSLYARLSGERGILGLLVFFPFLGYILFRAFNSQIRDFLFASLIGQLVNSFFIDSLHWRHLWLLIALAYI